MKENILQSKSYLFALRIIKLYKFLTEEKKEYILSKQVMRSGTSIGASIAESVWGASRKDFLSKITIAYKEARETIYWLQLLKDSEYLTERQVNDIMVDCEELCKIMGSIQTTIKKSSFRNS